MNVCDPRTAAARVSIGNANSLIHMYAKSGNLSAARSVFDSMAQTDVFSWNSMIMGYAQNGQGETALQLYELMQAEGYFPNISTYIAALTACNRLADNEMVRGRRVKIHSLQKGTRIHAQVVRSKLNMTVSLQNSLVDMYSKCGSLVDACNVFERMPIRTVISWNRILKGCVQNGENQLALKLYLQMQDQGFSPNAHTLVTAGKACAVMAEQMGNSLDMSCLERGIEIHLQAVKTGNAGHVFVESILVDMYAKCGSLEDAREVFERMGQRDSVCWSCIVNGYAQSGKAFMALELFSRMQLENDVVPNTSTFVGALKACACLAEKKEQVQYVRKRCLERGRILHCQAVKSGHRLNNFLANTLIDMYAKCDSMEEAKIVFYEMQEHDVISWTTMILGLVRCGDDKQALEMYLSMRSSGLENMPDAVVLGAALKACANLADKEQGIVVEGKVLKVESLETGKGIHAEAIRHGHDRDLFVASKLLDMYSKCGSMTDARQVFEKMQKRDDISWACIILGYAQNGQSEMALELYWRLQQQEDLSMPANVVTYVAALRACGDLGALDTGRHIHETIRTFGLENEMKICNSLMDFYSKCRKMDEAEHVFSRMKTRDVVAWNTLITGYSRQGDFPNAFDVFDRLLEKQDVKPNDVTFLSLLAVCSHAGMVVKGKECFQLMKFKHGVIPRVEHYSCMVDLLGRANLLEEAMVMVENMPMPPCESVWLSLLSSCRRWKNVALGRRAFEALVQLDSKSSAAYALATNISEHLY